jgi:excisionase family DNA binding protein
MQLRSFLKFVRPKELSKLLAVSPRTIRQWQASRVIPFHKIRQTVLFDYAKVIEALERFERKAAA